MKIYNKIALICLMLISLMGCDRSNYDIDLEELPEFTITIYYLDTCGSCRALKDNLVPEIKSAFKGKVTINQISADNQAGIEAYAKIVGYHDEQTGEFIEGKLIDFDENFIDMYYVPFVVVDDRYAFLGFDERFIDKYIEDIESALLSRELSTELAEGRWFFK